eukprot:gene26873-4482_t
MIASRTVNRACAVSPCSVPVPSTSGPSLRVQTSRRASVIARKGLGDDLLDFVQAGKTMASLCRSISQRHPRKTIFTHMHGRPMPMRALMLAMGIAVGCELVKSPVRYSHERRIVQMPPGPFI